VFIKELVGCTVLTKRSASFHFLKGMYQGRTSILQYANWYFGCYCT